MASVQEHYARHLAPHYTWMAGGAAGPRQRFTDLCRQLGLRPSQPGATALDLGAGNGFQSIPLAAAGYRVTAVDLSPELLAELTRDAGDLPVTTVVGDLRDIAVHAPRPAPEVIVCMGDTLTHLDTLEDVAKVSRSASAALAPGGHLLLGFRDYTTERTGNDRFIPVRSDDERILTCFLEFGATHVTVSDIVHARSGERWQMAISHYQKVRISPSWIIAQLRATGFTVAHQTVENGLVTIAALLSPSP